MKSKINIKHGRYYAVKGYQIVARVTDAELAKALGITVRTLQNKRGGRSDFTASEALIMSKLEYNARSAIPDKRMMGA